MAPTPKILLLGASGASGIQFIPVALAHISKPNLTFYVRDPNKIPEEHHSNPRITIVIGSLTSLSTLTDAMEGCTAVISMLGAYPTLSALVWRTTTTPIADSFPTIFAAMRAQNVKRILALSTPNFESKDDKPDWSWWAQKLMPPIVVPQGCAEMKGIGKQVSGQEDLDWTVFRVPFLNDGGEELRIAAGVLGPENLGTKSLSRKSLAKWLLDELEERKYVHEMPVLGNY